MFIKLGMWLMLDRFLTTDLEADIDLIVELTFVGVLEVNSPLRLQGFRSGCERCL